MSIVIVLVFAVLACLGMPLAFTLGFASLAGLFMGSIDFVVMPQRMMHAIDFFPLISIPLFMVAGELMVEGGIMDRLVDFANSVVGRVHGGLAHVAVLTGALLASVSGGHGRQLGQHPLHRVGHQLLVAERVGDENGVHTVAGRAPLVLIDVPRRHDVQLPAAVQGAREALHQALGERCNARQLGEVGGGVAGPHLDRAQTRRGPHVPADLGEVLDDAGVDHVPGVGLELVPGVQLVGRPGCGQLLEHHCSVVGVAGKRQTDRCRD